MHIGIAADHGGYNLKETLARALEAAGHNVVDFGATELRPNDDYPDYIEPLARAIARAELDRGIAICASGVGACIVANKISGVRAASCSDYYSAHQGVEDDDLNILCIGQRVMGFDLAWDVVGAFLAARFRGEQQHLRRLTKIANLERDQSIAVVCVG